jgi:hypothetical protein
LGGSLKFWADQHLPWRSLIASAETVTVVWEQNVAAKNDLKTLKL